MYSNMYSPLQGVVFSKNHDGKWVASVRGFKAEGRTKRLAQQALKKVVPATQPVRWVKEESNFFR